MSVRKLNKTWPAKGQTSTHNKFMTSRAPVQDKERKIDELRTIEGKMRERVRVRKGKDKSESKSERKSKSENASEKE